MFSKLPTRITSPFGILGDDAKLAFRTQPGGIRRLAEVRSIGIKEPYWDQYITLFDSPSDVFSLISSNDIRRALTDAPENVGTLVRVLSARLSNLMIDHTFPTPSPTGVSSFASSLIKTAANSTGVTTQSSQRDPTKEVLNCLRVLQRVLPVLFEGEFSELETRMLWHPEETQESNSGHQGLDDQPQFVIEDEDDEDTPKSPTSPSSRSRGEPADLSESTSTSCIAEKLIKNAIDLLFCCGFTLPAKLQVDHYKYNYVIWEKGVGSTIDPGPTQTHDQNKVEVLRFFLVLLSRQIYTSPSSVLTTASTYSLMLVQKVPRRHILTILCSLLNTAMNSTLSSPTGVGLGSMAAALPYNHLVFKAEDSRTTLVGQCLQVLCAILDFQSGPARDPLSNPSDTSTATPSSKSNAFRYFLAKLHRPTDFEFITDGILGILHEYMAAVNNVLPGSKKPIPYLLETIVFFWKMIELNKKFRNYVLESTKAVDLMTYLLCYFMDSKDKQEHHGLCRAISYILQALSAEGTFNDRLAMPIKMQLPAKWAISGNAGDFMINSIYAVVATTSGALNSLYPALIIALSNSAPYFKNISVQSSNRLVSLFVAFTNPSFLLSDEGHPRLLFFLLEVFNGVVLNHLNENPNLIYAILRSHKSFEDLGTFTLARGLREIRRVQLAKEEQAKRLAKGKNRQDSDQEAPEQEKARLLSTENRDALGLSAEVDLEARMPRERPLPSLTNANRESNDSEIENALNTHLNETSETDVGSSTRSEKSRGKMRERVRSSSLDTSESLERIAAAGVGRNGFIPTQDWVTSWQHGLPLDTVLLLISELLPKVHNIQSTSNKASVTVAILDFLRSVSLQDIFPQSQSPPCRKFMWTDASIIWLTSLIWGDIYVRGMTPLGIWNATNVRLFHVKHTQSQNRQITDAMSHVVEGIGGLLGRQGSTDNLPVRTRR